MSSSHIHIHKSSILSQTSQSMSGSMFEKDTLTDAELIKLVNELKDEIKLLKLENEILEKTIMRVEPALMHGVYQALEYATKKNSSSSLNMGSFLKTHLSKYVLIESLLSSPKLVTSPSRAVSRKSSSRIGGTVIFGSGPKINVLEMLELVSVEIKIEAGNLENVRNKAAKQHAYLKAQLEEIEIRFNDTEKAGKLFKQDVLIDGWDKIAQRIPAEIWIRFMTEWVKITDRQIDKLRLRTSTLNTQHSRFKGQIKLKTEIRESLRPVDFEKLAIENSECVKIIEQKILHLGELKKLTGDANLTLTVHNKAMMKRNSYLTQVMTTTMKKIEQTEAINKEHDMMQTEVTKLSQSLDEIRKIKKAYKALDVMDYVAIKWDISDLTRSIKFLEHRAHIHQSALSSVNKQLQKLENEIY